jgi:hypothetical protein
VEGADGVDVTHVSLNGLPPGTPVTTSFTLAPGASTNLTVTARFVIPDPLGFYQIVLQRSVGNGEWEPAASYGLRNVTLPEENPPLSVTVSSNGITLNWNSSGPCHVQSTAALQGPATVWIDVPGVPPVTIPISSTNQFFRLVCP